MSFALIAAKAATQIPWDDLRAGAGVLWDFYIRWRKERKDGDTGSAPSRPDDPAAITKRLEEFENDVDATMQALRTDLEKFSKRHNELAAATQILSARVMVAVAVAGISLALALGSLVWLLLR
jgi:hypothetical protein